MRIRMVKWGLVLVVLVSFAGNRFEARNRVTWAAEGDKAASDKAATPSINSPPGESASPGETRMYELHVKVKDFPEREDLSTPEGAYAAIHRAYAAEGDAAWKRLSVPELAAVMPDHEKKPLPKETAERFLDADILEVHVWYGVHAEVIARMIDGSGSDHIDLRALKLIEGRWLNNGNNGSDTLEHARQRIAKIQAFDAARRLRNERPPVADPAAHLKLFVDFLKREAKDPQEFVLDAIAKHRLVILSELHHRPRQWAFASSLVRSPEFARRVSVIYLETAHERPAAWSIDFWPPTSTIRSRSSKCCATCFGRAGPISRIRFLPRGVGGQPEVAPERAAEDRAGGHGTPLGRHSESARIGGNTTSIGISSWQRIL